MRKIFLSTCLLFFNSFFGYSQQVVPEIIAASGEHYTSVSSQLSWTLGEIVIDTYSSLGNILTQGFHQTQLTPDAILENILSYDVQLYPNPTQSHITLKINGKHNGVKIQMYDLQGKETMPTINLEKNEINIDLSSHSAGCYLLQLMDKNSNTSNVYRIIKSEGSVR